MEIPSAMAKIIADLLKVAAEEFSKHGCCDYTLENNPENNKIVADAFEATYGEPIPTHSVGTQILIQDHVLMSGISDIINRAMKE